jgi:hypothetical protein
LESSGHRTGSRRISAQHASLAATPAGKAATSEARQNAAIDHAPEALRICIGSTDGMHDVPGVKAAMVL